MTTSDDIRALEGEIAEKVFGKTFDASKYKLVPLKDMYKESNFPPTSPTEEFNKAIPHYLTDANDWEVLEDKLMEMYILVSTDNALPYEIDMYHISLDEQNIIPTVSGMTRPLARYHALKQALPSIIKLMEE